MKLSLVVASGVHEGKAIPITVPQFVIGRDPQCQLRPASPAISKRHCACGPRRQGVRPRLRQHQRHLRQRPSSSQGEVEVLTGPIQVGPLDFRDRPGAVGGMSTSAAASPRPGKAAPHGQSAAPAAPAGTTMRWTIGRRPSRPAARRPTRSPNCCSAATTAPPRPKPAHTPAKRSRPRRQHGHGTAGGQRRPAAARPSRRSRSR